MSSATTGNAHVANQIVKQIYPEGSAPSALAKAAIKVKTLLDEHVVSLQVFYAEEARRIQLEEDLKKVEEANELLRRERDGEVWCWTGDPAQDDLRSLTCPVLVPVDQVRKWVSYEVRMENSEARAGRLETQAREFREAEREMSTAYLRLRNIIGHEAFRTEKGEPVYEVTEKALNDVMERLEAFEVDPDVLRKRGRGRSNVESLAACIEGGDLFPKMIQQYIVDQLDLVERLTTSNPPFFVKIEWSDRIREAVAKDVTLNSVVHLLAGARSWPEFGSMVQECLVLLSSQSQKLMQVALKQAMVTPPSVRVSRFDSMSLLQQDQWEWSSKAFPGQPEGSMIKHLRDEVNNELHEECDSEELADIGLILMAIASKRGVDLYEVMQRKLKVCRARKWVQDGGEGFPSHVKDEQPESLQSPAEDGSKERKSIMRRLADGFLRGKDSQPTCRCRCHVDPNVRHCIPCCGRSPGPLPRTSQAPCGCLRIETKWGEFTTQHEMGCASARLPGRHE